MQVLIWICASCWHILGNRRPQWGIHLLNSFKVSHDNSCNSVIQRGRWPHYTTLSQVLMRGALIELTSLCMHTQVLSPVQANLWKVTTEGTISNLVASDRWPLITGSPKQQKEDHGTKQTVANVYRWSLYRGGYLNRFDCICGSMDTWFQPLDCRAK